MKNIIKKILSTSLLALPVAVFAASFSNPPTEVINPTLAVKLVSLSGILGLVKIVVNFIGSMFFAVSAVFILYAGYLYLTAEGETEKVGTAKTQLIYSLIGIAIGLVAFSATAIVSSFLTTPGA